MVTNTATEYLCVSVHVRNGDVFSAQNYSELVFYVVEGTKELVSQVHSLTKSIRVLEGEEAQDTSKVAPRYTKRQTVKLCSIRFVFSRFEQKMSKPTK